MVWQWELLHLLFFSEICLQYLEHHSIFKILSEQRIKTYFRYVDDVLIVYNTKVTDLSTAVSAASTTTVHLRTGTEDMIIYRLLSLGNLLLLTC
jgi:hypothetical protein